MTLNMSSVNIAQGTEVVSTRALLDGGGLNLGLVESQHQHNPSTEHGHVQCDPDFKHAEHSSSVMDWSVVSPIHCKFPPRQFSHPTGLPCQPSCCADDDDDIAMVATAVRTSTCDDGKRRRRWECIITLDQMNNGELWWDGKLDEECI